jgi:hypothetical protein
MSKDPLHQILHGLAHGAQHEYRHGNKKVGAGVGLIVAGIALMPIPFIGIPLIIMGICKLFS